MAKSLVRNRHAVTKMYGLKSQLQAVSLRIAVHALRELSPSACRTLLFWLVAWPPPRRRMGAVLQSGVISQEVLPSEFTHSASLTRFVSRRR